MRFHLTFQTATPRSRVVTKSPPPKAQLALDGLDVVTKYP